MIARLHADEGRGPLVVYVPGIDGSGDLLLGTAARLAQRMRLVRLRYEPDGEDTYGALARGIGEILDGLGDGPGEGRAVLLAESFGVGVALQTALERPDRVAALALVNGFARYPSRGRLGLARLLAPFAVRPLFRSFRGSFGPWALFGPRREPGVVREFREAGGVQFDGAYRRRLSMIHRLDLLPRLEEVRQPVALFAADADLIVASVRAAREMEHRLPDATLEILPRAGHLVLPLADEPWAARLEVLRERAGAQSPRP